MTVMILADELQALAERALCRAGVAPAVAVSVARALVWADSRGIATHGVSRLPVYLQNLAARRVEALAMPRVERDEGAVVLIDAQEGFAYPGLAMLAERLLARLPAQGVMFGALRNSHHFGAAAYHLQAAGEAGKVGLIFGNTPAAMPAWGGKRPLFGTNPLAAVFPRRDGPPLLIDLSLTTVTKGRIAAAASRGEAIPAGWALDADGQPTTDAQCAMRGSLSPLGGVKGSMLALIIELLCAGLTGASFGFEADSFFLPEGNRARIAQCMLLIDPAALGGQAVFFERVETLVSAMLAEDGVRLPGERGEAAARAAAEQGIALPADLLASIRLAAGVPG